MGCGTIKDGKLKAIPKDNRVYYQTCIYSKKYETNVVISFVPYILEIRDLDNLLICKRTFTIGETNYLSQLNAECLLEFMKNFVKLA